MILVQILQDLAMILQDLTTNPARSCHDPPRSYQNPARSCHDLAKNSARSCHDPPRSYQNPVRSCHDPTRFYQVRDKNTWQIQNEEALHEIYRLYSGYNFD
jgi:hypothetical protein